MTDPYEEIVNGERLLRLPPRQRHEEIVRRLHQRVASCVATLTSTKILEVRSAVEISAGTLLRPDLALLAAPTNKLWLVAEVISSEDHHADTVEKKTIYEEVRLPRLWIVDPRYDNVEVYHGTQYGLTLKRVLAGRDLLTDGLLPGFQLALHELFAGPPEGVESGRYDF